MAEYHLTLKNISRINGRNAVKSAAYRHGQLYRCEQTQEAFNYSRKKDVEHCEISIPENSPKWVRELLTLDVHEASEKLWNAVEVIEKRKDARLAKEVEFSLPHELNREQRLILAREFIVDNFTSKGMIADWAVHNHFDEKDGIEKPHVHVMLTTRALKESFGKEKEILRYQGIAFGEKDRSWDRKSFLHEIRENWDVCANRHLEKAGLDVRIDHRSYKERGIDLEVQPKIGKGPREMAGRGYVVDRLKEFESIKEKNRKLIHQNPDLVLDYITRQQSVFTKKEIARVINRYVDYPEEAQMLRDRIEASSQLVMISDDRPRHDKRGFEQKFTTREMIDLELSLIRKAEVMKEVSVALVSEENRSQLIQAANDSMEKGHFSSDQVQAVYHMTDPEHLKVVVGYAGAGKSTCLKVAKDVWEQEGYRVLGAAPTGKATDNLEGTGIASKTLHKWDHEWKKGQELLGKKDIFVVDEAGMIDSRRLNSLLDQSQKLGFKVVLIGDPEQLSPIEAGCGLRTVMDKAGFVQMNTIHRQHEDWQKEATKDLATQQTRQALRRYEEKGCIHLTENAKTKLIADYAKEMQAKRPEESLEVVILAYTNKDVRDLNEKARKIAGESGRLQGPEHVLTVTRYKNSDSLDSRENNLLKVVHEEKSFAVGDQIVFLRNDYGVGVKNGQFGIIRKIDEGMIDVEVDKQKTITFDLSLYRSFDHGYAITIHKSQASTLEKTFLYAGPGMDRHLTYVGLSRHRDEVHLYAEKDIFKSHENLYSHLSRENIKENVFDYDVDLSLRLYTDLKREASYLSYTPSHSPSPSFLEKVDDWIQKTVDKTKDQLERWREEKLKENIGPSQNSRSSPDFLALDSSPKVQENRSSSLPQDPLFSFEDQEKEKIAVEKDPLRFGYLENSRGKNTHEERGFSSPLTPKDLFLGNQEVYVSSPTTVSEIRESRQFSEVSQISTPSSLETKASVLIDQGKNHNSYQQERHDSILAYLKEEVRLEKHAWLKESSVDFFLKDAEKDPMKSLLRWQDVSHDKSFIPMTKEEKKFKNLQAQELLVQAQASLSQKDFEKLTQDLPGHPSGIISRCQNIFKNQQEKQRDLDAERFISLSRQYSQHCLDSFGSPSEEKQSLRKAIHELSALYKKDEEFLKKIEGVEDKKIKSIALELFRNKDLEKEQDLSLFMERSLGFER